MAAINPVEILQRLTNDEKAKLLSGEDMWHTAPIPRLGIPRVRMSDGPNGVRGTAWTNAAPAACFPCATALAASFDTALLERVGVALGKECRARGVHCLLGPTTNIQRHPCGGRGFESFSEDPCLSGTMASAWIRGVQSQDVMTTPKHFVANEQEHCRRSNNSIIDLRTLHEIYLEPFRLQMKAKPTVFMSSYNRVNGIHAAEDPFLLREILRGDWGFSGMIMSDWSGTYSSAGAIKAGLDLEMPGPTMMRGMCIDRDLVSGKLRPSDVDECVLRVLDFIRQAQLSRIPFDAKEETIDDPHVRQAMLDAARAGIVLLKNETKALPLSITSSRKIAVVGYNAKYPSNTGGGSANLATTYLTSLLDEIKKDAKQCSASVEYAMGVDASRWTPLLTPFLGLPGGQVGKGHCVECTFYTEDPWTEGSSPEPVFQLKNNNAFTYFIDGIPGSVPVRGYVSLKTEFVPDQSGKWELGLGVAGQADLYLNGKRVIENSENQKPDILFFNTGSKERACVVDVVKGTRYQMEVRFSNFKQINSLSPYAGRRGGIRLGGRALRDPKLLVQEAVDLAERSDVTIAVVGTTPEWESEGYDRTDMALPPGTDDLIKALLSTKRNVIVVNQSGMPVRLPWIDQAPTFVQALFGGNEGGRALVDVLTGKHNPSGKLPFTWGAKEEDYPSHNSFGQTYDSVYEEGLEVGYRYFDGTTSERTPLFAFGHGLSYTQFQYSSLTIKPTQFGCTVSVGITNIGQIDGEESCQVYVHASSVEPIRPKLELGGFAKVALDAGETKRVSVELDHKSFSFYDTTKLMWRAQRGSYEIRIGRSAFDIVASAPFLLDKAFVWKGLEAPRVI